MRRTLLALLLFLLPSAALAASSPSSFVAGRTVLLASSSPGSAYAAGASVVVTAPVEGDLSALGGSVIAAAPIAGDALLIGGSLQSRAAVGGDVRVAGGRISIEGPAAGDLVAFGLSVRDAGRPAGSVFIAAANVTLLDGAGGPVTLYGNNVLLAGDFADDVTIVSSGRITLAASTTIVGTLSYEAPDEAAIPPSVAIRGGVEFKSTSYLPDVGTSRILAIISISFFLLVRIVGALILAGLLAGLFPRFATLMVERTEAARPRAVLLTILLGFAAFVVTPALFLLLTLTFVGIGLALLSLVLYALMALLSLIYAGILLGSFLARRYAHRTTVFWHDGVVGMLLLSLVALVPYIGFFVVLFLTFFSAGALLRIFFDFAFPHEEQTAELL